MNKEFERCCTFLAEMMEQKNITQLELSRRTRIATSNISDWKKKKTNPKFEAVRSEAGLNRFPIHMPVKQIF